MPLTQGKFAWVDAADFDAVMATGSWCAVKHQSGNWYAARNIWVKGREITKFVHRFLTGWSMVDHWDRNGLNNRRSNLRKATATQNAMNRRLACNNTSGYIGVSQVNSGRYQAKLVNEYLGLHDDPRAAARAWPGPQRVRTTQRRGGS
ncbi:MAG TPA: hypothetical protein VME19_21325 [Streptosporangiaceae bacterium]|nr:hypothetical protein [Streptosporangiaceae bacterium]